MNKTLLTIGILICNCIMCAENLSCVGYDLRSDEYAIRASGSASDKDSVVARTKALLIAKQRAITQMETIVIGTTEIYMSNATTAENLESVTQLVYNSKTKANQLLMGCQPICEQIQRDANYGYEASVAIELPNQNMIDMLEKEGKSHHIDMYDYLTILRNKLNSLEK